MKTICFLFFAVGLIVNFPPASAAPPVSKKDAIVVESLNNEWKLPKYIPLPKGITPPAHISCVYADKMAAKAKTTVYCPISGLTNHSFRNPYHCTVNMGGCHFNSWSALKKGEICYGMVICTQIRNISMPTHNNYGGQSQLVPIPKKIHPPAHLTCHFRANKKDIVCHVTAQTWKTGGIYTCKLRAGTLMGMYSVLKPGEMSLGYFIDCFRNDPLIRIIPFITTTTKKRK